MYYFITGNVDKALKKSAQLIDSMLSKKPDAEVFKINSENWNQNKFDELLGGQSLFTKKYIVQMSRVLENPEAKDFLLKNLEEIKKSENIFVWSDFDLKSPELKKIEKHAEKVQNFEEKKTATRKDFSGFAMADALGQRNSKKLWLLYLENIKNSAPEELHGILWWQIKSMKLASVSKSASESGLKPFVYTKSKKYAANFTEEELEDLQDKMIEIYHRSHRSESDLALELERVCLGV